MNKKFFFLSLFSILISCNNDAEKNSEKRLILPKTIIYKDAESDYISITNLVYKEKKLLTIGNKNRRNDYLYDGDRIVRETKYDYKSGKEIEVSKKYFTYIGNKLLFTNKIENGRWYKYSYIYNEDGTIKRESYEINDITGEELKRNTYEILIFTDGNLIKKISFTESNSITFTKTCFYEYDLSSNVFKNVLGLNLLLDELSFDSVGYLFSTNNLKKVSEYSSFQFDNNMLDYFSFFDYEYNINGYPIKKKCYGLQGVNSIIEYRY
ncbi:hypothetical protein HYN56_10240 [Flavobacterium crocinum]|uniref:DUF4595 domain-containing protein n=1 Tax=Flavobacterium crocinum TaxID=2183896 RepID=A0A2S1YKI2_9FLAO|nr:hypothetical protein [Flavobacterium crocinum]AWK04585.1 hypothetical protein HYN56_10240 [Flavobacterium crocinum]